MQVGSKNVNMHRMVAWQLPSRDGLKLSVPIEMQAELIPLLMEAQAKGKLSDSMLQTFADDWELVNAEVASSPTSTEPATFLVCSRTLQAMVCARWPLLDFAGPARIKDHQAPPFDPVQHFC